jgi:hypothetical protein
MVERRPGQRPVNERNVDLADLAARVRYPAIGQGHRANALTPPRSISSTQPLQNRRVRLYEVSEVSGNARVAALLGIIKLTTALYHKHFADQCEYSLRRATTRHRIGPP